MKYEDKTEPRGFGELLKSARKAKKLTQTQLAALVYSTAQAVQRWERGQNDPKASTITRLCEALDVEPNYFFGYHVDGDEHPRTKYYREKLNQVRRVLL